MREKCLIDECSSDASRRGFCNKHYRRWAKYGDAEITSYERVSKGVPQRFVEVALSSDLETCIIWPYSKDSDGYGWALLDGMTRSVHRYVCEKEHGPPIGERNQAAHSCGEPACINRKHLRWATRSENMMDKHEHFTMRVK
jgi:hypothetical protein